MDTVWIWLNSHGWHSYWSYQLPCKILAIYVKHSALPVISPLCFNQMGWCYWGRNCPSTTFFRHCISCTEVLIGEHVTGQWSNNEESHCGVGLLTLFKWLQCTPEANISITETSKRLYWLSMHSNQLYNFSSPKPWIIWNCTDQNHGKISAFFICGLGPVAYWFSHTGP